MPENAQLAELAALLARIDQRLNSIGLSAHAASKAAGKPDAIRNIRRAVETGRAGVSTATIAALAPVLQTTVAWLTAEAGPEESASTAQRPVIPVVGRVGAGGAISTEAENLAAPLFEIELPFPIDEDAVGFEIHGDSMWPRYDAGDVIVVSRHCEPLDGLLGFEAVVRVGAPDEPGDRFFKRVIRGAEQGTFDLESYNAPPMRNQRIGWAAGLIFKSSLRCGTGRAPIAEPHCQTR